MLQSLGGVCVWVRMCVCTREIECVFALLVQCPLCDCECTSIRYVYMCVFMWVLPPTPTFHPPRVWSRLQGLVQEQSWDHGGSTAGICPQEAAPAPCSWHWGLHEPGNGTPPRLHPPLLLLHKYTHTLTHILFTLLNKQENIINSFWKNMVGGNTNN